MVRNRSVQTSSIVIAVALHFGFMCGASAATPAENFENAKPALQRYFGCKPAKNETFDSLAQSLYAVLSAFRIDSSLLEPTKLPGTLEVAGVPFEQFMNVESGGVAGVYFKVTTDADLKKLITTYKLKHVKTPFIGSYDWVRELQSSVRVGINSTDKTFACLIGEEEY